jgi:hypothetical protein
MMPDPSTRDSLVIFSPFQVIGSTKLKNWFYRSGKIREIRTQHPFVADCADGRRL